MRRNSLKRVKQGTIPPGTPFADFLSRYQGKASVEKQRPAKCPLNVQKVVTADMVATVCNTMALGAPAVLFGIHSLFHRMARATAVTCPTSSASWPFEKRAGGTRQFGCGMSVIEYCVKEQNQ